jgi:hypothetical protein
MMANRKAMENYLKYLDTYSGRRLLEKYTLEQEGIWEIRGEDPNCDLGGAHHQPKLGIVQGRLQDIIMFGANLDRFWQWGAGGDFEFIGESIPKVDQQVIDADFRLREEAEQLEARLAEINRTLGRK